MNINQNIQNIKFDFDLKSPNLIKMSNSPLCSICFKQNEREDPQVKTECGHIFCYGCFIQHFTSGHSFSSKCPNCRSALHDGVSATASGDIFQQQTTSESNPLAELLDLPGVGRDDFVENNSFNIDHNPPDTPNGQETTPLDDSTSNDRYLQYQQRLERRMDVSFRRTLHTMADLDMWTQDIIRQWRAITDDEEID